ncbi:MAG: HD domain-containing phosphohydrolase [Desulfuromonadales bacterium]
MNLESIQYFFQKQLPGIIIDAYYVLVYYIDRIPASTFIVIILVLCAFTAWALMRQLRIMRSETIKNSYFKEISGMTSMQEMFQALNAYFRKIEPDIMTVGVYLKDKKGYKLANEDVSGPSKKPAEDGSSLEKQIFSSNKYMKRGRFHIYTFIPEQGKSAVRIVAYNSISIAAMQAELYYLTAFFENLMKGEEASKELIKAKLVESSSAVFTSFLSNREDYFRLVATIIITAYRIDTMRIIFPDRETVLGSMDFQPDDGKLFYVRNTDIKVHIHRKTGILQEDVVNIGRFLDLISATLAMYSSETHITNYIAFLEAAIDAFENSDKFDLHHSEKLRVVALSIGKALNYDNKRLQTLMYACKFHDIGMMGHLYDIASQNIAITEKERSRIKYHPVIGYTMTKPLDSAYPISSIILQHHEFLDSTGYPDGLPAESISEDARILAFSEVLIGAVSDRPHRQGKSKEAAVQEIETLVPNKLDSKVFEAFIENKDTIFEELAKL